MNLLRKLLSRFKKPEPIDFKAICYQYEFNKIRHDPDKVEKMLDEINNTYSFQEAQNIYKGLK